MSEQPDDLEYRPVWARGAAKKAARGGGPSFKSLFINLISLAVVVAAVSFIAAPGVAFFAIRAAAEANDAAGLAQLIDYNAVRQSLRPQLNGRPEVVAPPPSFLEDPIGAVRRQFQDHPIAAQPDVDAYLTPRALQGLTGGQGRAASLPAPPSGFAEDRAASAPWPRPAYWSVNRARLTVAGADAAPTVFTFERRGPFEWKLVHVALPASGAAAPAAATR